jgi:hypothetical protein
MAENHICLHEEDFGTFKSQLASIDKKQDKTIAAIEGLFARIEGKDGITSEIAILKTQYKLAPSAKILLIYSSVGGGFTAFVIFLITLAVKAWGGKV